MSVWAPGPNTPDQTDPPASPSRPETLFVDYFDGARALRQRAGLSVEAGPQGHSLRLDLPDGTWVRWPLREIRRLPDQAPGEAVAYGLASGKGGRIVAEGGVVRDLVERLHPDVGEALDTPPLARRALAVAVGGAVILALLFLLVLPGLAGVLARLMNAEAEVAMGEMHYQQTRQMFSGTFKPLQECRNPAGLAALERLTDRVAKGVDLPYPLQVVVLDDSANPTLNAYAVAGGRITFFNTMIEAAESPEEIAAVLAHELGHVVNNDPVRHQLQAASGAVVLSVLIGDVTGGGVLGSTAGAALVSGYSRRAEIAADDFAHRQLTEVGLPPSALGRMFERLRDEYGDVQGLLAHFSTHPALADRIEMAAGQGDPSIGAPALTPKDWQALRAICL